MRKKKKKLEIKKWGESLIERLSTAHCYLERQLSKTAGGPFGSGERLELLKFKNLLRDMQLFIEKDL